MFFYFVPPITIEEEFLLPIAEFTTRANHNMTFGNFELNFSDGEVNYKTTIRWRDELFNLEEIMDALDTGVSMWGMYLPGFLSILNDGTTPQKVIEGIRG